MMLLLLVCGPALVACADALWPNRSLVAVAAVSTFGFVQFVLVALNSDYRTGGTDWHERWVSNGLPQSVTDQPVAFVGFTRPSISWMSVFVHPESRFMPMPISSGVPARDPGLVAR